jgi:hypothetical protein
MLLAMLMLSVSFDSFSQDSLSRKYILIVEKRVAGPGSLNSSDTSGKAVSAHIFNEGCRVAVRTTDNKYIVGRIRSISDSSIVIKEHTIKISQIRMICVYRGIETSIAGFSILSGGFLVGGLIQCFSEEDEYGYKRGWEGTVVSIMTGIVVGSCTTLVGIIEMAATRHYSMKKKYYLDVQPSN